jgi:hypothetical protein
MSALPPKAQRDCDVRFVPQTDSCTATKLGALATYFLARGKRCSLLRTGPTGRVVLVLVDNDHEFSSLRISQKK